MDSLFHFLFPIIAALAARVHVKHTIRNVIILGILAASLDVDHFIGPGLSRALLHNVFVTILIPLILIFFAFVLRTSIYTKGFTILLLVFLSSHLFLDLFGGGEVAILYPLSDKYYSINFDLSVPLANTLSEGEIVSSFGIGLLLYFIIVILPCLFLDDIIEIMEKKHENLRKAVRDLMK